jgi:hypothetical protein
MKGNEAKTSDVKKSAIGGDMYSSKYATAPGSTAAGNVDNGPNETSRDGSLAVHRGSNVNSHATASPVSRQGRNLDAAPFAPPSPYGQLPWNTIFFRW